MSKVSVSDANYAEVYDAYLSQGNAVELKDGFTGVGGSGQGNGFNEGDVISLPSELKVIGITIQGSTKKAEAIICRVTDKNGVVRFQPFFIKSLAKRVNALQINDENHVLGQKLRPAEGTAAKWYQERAGRKVNDIAMELLAQDKDIKVTKVESVKTYRYGSTDIICSNIYTFDFV